MADGIVDPHHRHLRRDGRRLRRARPRRLLGRVVRSVQDDRPDPRARSPPSRPASHHRQAQRRRQPRPRPALRRDEHPDPARVQRGRGAEAARRRQGQGSAARRSSTNSSDRLPLTPGQTRRSGPRSAAPPRCRRVRRPVGAEAGAFCPATETARARLPARLAASVSTARCDEQTWLALVEASWQLGDRSLYHRSPEPARRRRRPSCRRRSAASASTPGGSTASSGRTTARALDDFQRNVGLPPDGICGHETVHALRAPRRPDDRAARSPRSARASSCAAARRTLAGRRIVVGPVRRPRHRCRRAVANALRQAGAAVMTLDEPDASAHAAGRQPLRRRRLPRVRPRPTRS